MVGDFRVQQSPVYLGWLPWAKVRAWGVRMPAVADQRHKSVAYEVDLEQKQRNPVEYSQCDCFVKDTPATYTGISLGVKNSAIKLQ